MATLHMDVEACRNVQSQINNIQSQMSSEVSTMTSTIQGMVGGLWMGNSANEFSAEYDNWRATMNQLLEALLTLDNRLSTEITEWETMASKLA